MVKTYSLTEMRKIHKNKTPGHFFDRGNPPVVAKRGNYLVARSFGGMGYTVFRFDPSSGNFFVEGDTYPLKSQAVMFAEIKSGVRR